MIAKLVRLLRFLSLAGGLALLALGVGVAGLGLGYHLLHDELTIVEAVSIYMASPLVVSVGAGLLGAGVLLFCWEMRSHGGWLAAWRLALSWVAELNLLGLVCGISIASVAGLGALAYVWKLYEFTESDQLCTELCHQAMRPESEPHQDSAHAKVTCAECHVAPGIGGYVKAKVGGMWQVYRVLTNTYERPIHAPPHAIPAAEETCKRCHWENAYWGVKPDSRVRYGYDLQNSRRYVQVQTNVGGGAPTHGMVGGIHQHMLQHRLLFKSVGKLKQEIAQFTVVNDDGTRTVYDLYEKGERKYSEVQLADLEEEAMSCLDCHNRPAHQCLSPDEAIDRALQAGQIDRSLPFIKAVAVAAVNGEYASEQQATEGIAAAIRTYYTEHFQGTVLARGAALDQATTALQAIYKRSNFPDMRVTWGTYPDNTGHRSSAGCFRCHGGKHRARDTGSKPKGTCDSCHAFYEEARDGSAMTLTPADETWLHPFEHKVRFNQEINCWDCHAAASPYSQCKSCHEKDWSPDTMAFECSMCHRPRAGKVTVTSCEPCHPTAKSPMHQQKEHANCLACHKPHTWKADTQHASCGVTDCHKPADLEAWKAEGAGHDKCRLAEFKGVDLLMNGLPIGPAPAAVREAAQKPSVQAPGAAATSPVTAAEPASGAAGSSAAGGGATGAVAPGKADGAP